MSDQSENRPATFAELEGLESVEQEVLLESLAHYALNGWAIKGEVVIDIASRAGLTTRGLQQLGGLSYKGMERQAAGGRYNSSSETRSQETEEYKVVAAYAELRLVCIARFN